MSKWVSIYELIYGLESGFVEKFSFFSRVG